MNIVHDSCAPLTLVPAADATPAELRSLDEAMAMWNGLAHTRLGREPTPDAPELPLRFAKAALAFYGVYDDERGEVLINRLIEDDHVRAVTMAHEIGHSFGLWHIDLKQRSSVMNFNNLVIEPNEQDARDVAGLWGECPTAEAKKIVGG